LYGKILDLFFVLNPQVANNMNGSGFEDGLHASVFEVSQARCPIGKNPLKVFHDV
jgi:hypothetical protein